MTALRSTEIDNPLMELIRSSQLLAVPDMASVFWDGIGDAFGVVDDEVDEGWEVILDGFLSLNPLCESYG